MATVTPTHKVTHMPLDPKARPHYTPVELDAYFERINLPEQHRSSPVRTNPALAREEAHGLPLLRALHLHHVAAVPFENLELHYSTHGKISLHMTDLYGKFVTRGAAAGRGGRCMEQNGFFGTALRSLGFEVRNAAGRVSRSMAADEVTRAQYGATYDPWNHMLNLVRLGDVWWVVDVGMGAWGPAVVYPLRDGFEAEAISPRRIRLQRRAIPEHAASAPADAPLLWCYDVNLKGSGDQWTPTYCFTETEFLPQDYEMMSWFTSTHPKSFFTYSVLCTRLLVDMDNDRIVGDVTLFNDAVRETVAGKREVVRELKTESDRISALKVIFKVNLTDEEQKGISPRLRLS